MRKDPIKKADNHSQSSTMSTAGRGAVQQTT
jgi:hypothetical protein